MGLCNGRVVDVRRAIRMALVVLALPFIVVACSTKPQESEELVEGQDAVEQSIDQGQELDVQTPVADGEAMPQDMETVDELDAPLQEPVVAEDTPQVHSAVDEDAGSHEAEALEELDAVLEEEVGVSPQEPVMAEDASQVQAAADEDATAYEAEALEELDVVLEEEVGVSPQEPVMAEDASQVQAAADEDVTAHEAEALEKSDTVLEEESDMSAEVDALDNGQDIAQELEPEEQVEEIDLTPIVLDSDGPRYIVTKLVLQYGQVHSSLPSIEQLGDVRVDLLLTDTGYVAPRAGVPSVSVSLSSIDDQLSELDQFWFYGSAIIKIAQAVVGELNRQGLIGVYVAPHLEDIDEGEDLRPEQDTALRMVIRTVIVSQMRTLGSGDRVPSEERIDHPAHQSIKDRSPVKPAVEGDADRKNLLRRDLLDDYVYRLNRHPGRRVDVAVSRAEDQGGIVLDYLITENRPLLMYFQGSNTGTKQTNEWRERFGLVHNQLTGNDDTLSLDYITAGFDESHSFVGSYEAPLFENDRVQWRVFGSWSEFTASDVGATNEQFLGESWSAGGELITNIAQDRNLFLDFIVGARFEHIFVDNQAVMQQGEDDFLLVYLGLNLERIVEISSTLVSVSVERNLPGLADTEIDEITNFGRDQPEDRWTLLKWNVNQAFYLEPVFDKEAWGDASTPDTSTLAHEFVISFKGQHTFGTRVIPQMEQVAGGLYTVRGYEESIVAGDTVFIGSLEYRFHVPRVFKIQPNPSKTPLFGKPFRFAPQQVYARPDWDLIFRTFFDAARVIKSDRLSTETHDTLLSTGIGLELQFQRNINLRVDWGIALEEAGSIDDGNDEIHVVATFLF